MWDWHKRSQTELWILIQCRSVKKKKKCILNNISTLVYNGITWRIYRNIINIRIVCLFVCFNEAVLENREQWFQNRIKYLVFYLFSCEQTWQLMLRKMSISLRRESNWILCFKMPDTEKKVMWVFILFSYGNKACVMIVSMSMCICQHILLHATSSSFWTTSQLWHLLLKDRGLRDD